MAKSFSYFFELKKKNASIQKLTKNIEFLEKNKLHLEDLNVEYSEANARAQLLKSQWTTSYIPALDERHALSRQLAQAKYNYAKFEEECKTEIQWLSDEELKYEIDCLETDRPAVWTLNSKPKTKLVSSEMKTLTARDVCMMRETATAKITNLNTETSRELSVCSKASEKSFVTCASAAEPTNVSEGSTNSCMSTSSSSLSTAVRTINTVNTVNTLHSNETARRGSNVHSHTLPRSRKDVFAKPGTNSYLSTHSTSMANPLASTHSNTNSFFAAHTSHHHHKSWTVSTANNKLESLESKLAELQNETGYVSTLTSLLTSQLKMLQDEIISLQSAMTFPPENFYYPIRTELASFKLEIYKKELYNRKQEVSKLKIRSIPLIQKLTIDDVRI